MVDLDFRFVAKLWSSSGPGAWHFLTLPKNIAEEIKFFCERHVGFGTIRVKVAINQIHWETSIFPDKTSNSFLLPIKADIRKKAKLVVGESVTVELIVKHSCGK